MLIKRILVVAAWIAMMSMMSWPPALAGDLTFESRVEAQRAIERVYHSHRSGQPPPLGRTVPREVIENKVRTYLRQSRALEEIWNTPVTAEMLQAELRRIARSTRLPNRLQEIYEALGNDPVLIHECFARPVLVNRLVRTFFAGDRAIHRAARKEAEQLRDHLHRGELDLDQEHTRRLRNPDEEERLQAGPVHPSRSLSWAIPDDRSAIRSAKSVRIAETGGSFDVIVTDRYSAEVRYRVPKRTWDSWWSEIEAGLNELDERSVDASSELPLRSPRGIAAPSCSQDDVWDNGSLEDGLPEARAWHTAVWTGTEMLVWGGIVQPAIGSGGFLNGGLRYESLTDTWSHMSVASAPAGRLDHTSVWTGSEMIVWGGRQGSTSLDTGGRYDAAADTWTPTSTVGAPSPRAGHTAVWTGSVMVVWGGAADNSGGTYDAATDTWTPLSTINAPTPRGGHSAVWTGEEMLVWGGGFNTGGRYDPVSDSWAAMSTTNAPSARGRNAAVWTGVEMVVWGGALFGCCDPYPDTGGRYDPSSDTWRPTSTVGTPQPRLQATAIWTGSEVIVWGGEAFGFAGDVINTGGRYDPVTDTWASTDVIHAPDARSLHTAIWTGDRMIIWGGASVNNIGYRFEGARYDPVSDSWTPTLGTSNRPSPRDSHSAVWTGTEMIIWGGQEPFTYFSSGFRYDPLTDDWTAITELNGPSARDSHSAVWTGDRMIVWGGWYGSSLNTGGRYDPVSDSWQPTTLIGAPVPQSGHVSVWTGSVMLVWRGRGVTGGRYDPIADEWMSMSSLNAPIGRGAAVWTGSEMVVWGGFDGTTTLRTGGRYDPINDTWLPTSTDGAPPEGRVGHSAVWTGEDMIVWGGSDLQSILDTGFKYRPDTDTWEAISTISSPAAMSNHSAVWTGRLMIVWDGTGGRYDPARDAWSATSTVGAPLAGAHSCVWTDAGMIVWDSFYNLGTGGRYLVDTSPDADHDGITTCAGDCDDSESSVYAGAPQVCDGRNNDCSDPGWPGVEGTMEGDDDGDAFSECQGDCDDGSLSVWTTPGAVLDLGFIDSSTLGWNPPAQPGGTVIRYDALRSQLPWRFVTSRTCVEYDGVDTTAMDATVPSPGMIAYYLVRGQNACGLGSAGNASDGTPRAASDCTSPTSPSGSPFDR